MLLTDTIMAFPIRTWSLAWVMIDGSLISTLWPLFHYLPGEIHFDESQWDGYYRANVAFANAVKHVARSGDLIWVQDYHLMLLPALLRDALADLSNIRVGFFLHIPFPSSEVYRALPVQSQILRGLLQGDLIGFHTYDHVRHFLGACARLLGMETRPNGVFLAGRFVQVGSFPIGIEASKFMAALQTPAVIERVEGLRERFRGQHVILGVERLDYIKGVPHKLHALDIFLDRYPQFRGRVVLLQVAVPTRSDVEEYQNLRTTVNELVGRINSKYGTFDYTPVQYVYRSIPFDELVALYRLADVCLVTSTRDGMNLVHHPASCVTSHDQVALEYVASQQDQSGVLVLSEFAGAAQSMNGALIINPWNINAVADAIYEALTLPADMAAANQQKLLDYVQKFTASHWGKTFVDELQVSPPSQGPATSGLRLHN